MTSLEWQGAGLQHVVRLCWLCPLSHGTTKDMPPGDRAPGKRSPPARCPARPHTVSLHSGYGLGGAEHRDRHQLKPGNEALEVASCHPSRRHGIQGRTACSRALGTAGEGELKTGTTKGAGEALGTARTAAARHSAHPPPPLSFRVSTHLLQPSPHTRQQGSAPHTPEPPPTFAPLLSSHRGRAARVGPCQPAAPQNTPMDPEGHPEPARAWSPPDTSPVSPSAGPSLPGQHRGFCFQLVSKHLGPRSASQPPSPDPLGWDRPALSDF